MAKCEFLTGRVVADYTRPYIIAEVNSSHNGDLAVARQMIDAAVECGCDCVKFQSWSVESLYSATYYRANPISKRFVKKFALAPTELKEMADYCRTRGVDFASTPYAEDEVDFLVDECQAPFIKIASMELDNLDFLAYIARKQVPIVLSTGMGEMAEVRRAVKVLRDNGAKNICLLHCVSIYPTELTTVNLNNIIGLRQEFQELPVGFSDHTAGDAAAVAATALGVCVLEKHLTLDHTKIGMDNGMAMEPDALKVLVEKCHAIQLAMGTTERQVTEAEYAQRAKMRRSIIAVRDLPAGHVIERADLYAKRPGDGIPPTRMGELVGRRLKNAVQADSLIYETDLE